MQSGFPMAVTAFPALIFGIIWLVSVALMIGGWILLVASAWRGMKAHESIARSLELISIHRERDSETPR